MLSPRRTFVLSAICALLTAVSCFAAPEKPLHTFRLEEPLGHGWSEEIVHFDFAVKTDAENLRLVDDDGAPVPCQFEDLHRTEGGTVTGRLRTVVSLPADGSHALHLLPGTPNAKTALTLHKQHERYLLANRHIELELPLWTALAKQKKPLAEMEPPLRSIRRSGKQWLGELRWFDNGADTHVTEAGTTVLKQGPVVVSIRQQLTFAGGGHYRMEIELGARQEVARIREECTLAAPDAGLRLSLQPGLGADRLLWHNHWRKNKYAGSWKRVRTPLDLEKRDTICRLRPWSFWWKPGRSEWAGFYRQNGEDLVGLLLMRPSRWSPTGGKGFAHTELPVTAGPDGQVHVTLGLTAKPNEKGHGPTLRRVWGLTAGRTQDHLTDGAPCKLRALLIKHGEFPLDRIKDYGFRFQPAEPDREHPFLLFGPRDIERVRRTGPNHHHYHKDYNSFVYYAKGDPLCMDFGNQYRPTRRDESRYHNMVTPGKSNMGHGELVELRALGRTADYSVGLSRKANKRNRRHILMVKSDDPMGANYLLVRDQTRGGSSNDEFWWNLWCLSREPHVSEKIPLDLTSERIVHFPGRFDTDLDVHLLLPQDKKIEKDYWSWEVSMKLWYAFHEFGESQHGIHVIKKGPEGDFLALLYPRAKGQGRAETQILADGTGLRVDHIEGTDHLLLASGGGEVDTGDARLRGEVAMVRSYEDGRLRLAVLKGEDALAAAKDWSLESSGPTAVEIRGKDIRGESSGGKHVAELTLPPDHGPTRVTLDGEPAETDRQGRILTLRLPAGHHQFHITPAD